MNVISGSEGSVTMPTWELLPQTGGNQSPPVEHSSELIPPANQAVVAAVGSEAVESLKLSPDSDFKFETVTSDYWWQVNEKVAVQDGFEDIDTLITTDPTIIDYMRTHKREWHRRALLPSLKELIGGLAIVGTTTGSGIVGGVEAASLYLGSSAMTVGGIAGAVVGFFAAVPTIRGAQWLGDKISRFVAKGDDKKLTDLATKSTRVYTIPNNGVATTRLGSDVADALLNAEEPQELLVSKIAPIVSVIMQAEVELATIEPELQEIEARTNALGTIIAEDKINQGELLAKKSSLIGKVNKQREEILVINRNELKDRDFRNAVAEISVGNRDVAPYLREFQDGIVMAIKAAYTPQLFGTAKDALHDVAQSMPTVDEERLCRPVYDVLRKKWAKKGLVVPDFETLEQQIAQSRDLR